MCGGRAGDGGPVGAEDAARGLHPDDGDSRANGKAKKALSLVSVAVLSMRFSTSMRAASCGRCTRTRSRRGTRPGRTRRRGCGRWRRDAVDECRRWCDAARGEQVHRVVGDGLAGLVVEAAGGRVLVVDVAVEADRRHPAGPVRGRSLVDDGIDAGLAQVDRDRAGGRSPGRSGRAGRGRPVPVLRGRGGAAGRMSRRSAVGRDVRDGHVQEPAGGSVAVVALGLLREGLGAVPGVEHLDVRRSSGNRAFRQEQSCRLRRVPAAGVDDVEARQGRRLRRERFAECARRARPAASRRRRGRRRACAYFQCHCCSPDRGRDRRGSRGRRHPRCAR